MKNINYINKKVASNLGLSEDVVEKINDFYWETIKQKLRNLETEFIHIKKIGDFQVSGNKLDYQIKTLRNFIYNVRHSNKYTEERKELIIKDYIKRYVKCLRMRDTVRETQAFRDNLKLKDV